MQVEVRKGAARFLTVVDGISTSHSFSFGRHYDPDNVGFGMLTAHNDERLSGGGGYDTHGHADTEIVSFVLAGELEHSSTLGSAVLGVGGVQRLSAGSGVQHAERAVAGPTRFVQTWLRPRDPGGEPSYARAAVDLAEPVAGLVPLVGGDGVLSVAADARLFLGQGAAMLPEVAWAHLFVVSGEVLVAGERLAADDAARIRGGAEVSGRGSYLLWTP